MERPILLYNILKSCYLNNFGSVFIDGNGKGNPKIEVEIRKLTKHYNKKDFAFFPNPTYNIPHKQELDNSEYKEYYVSNEREIYIKKGEKNEL